MLAHLKSFNLPDSSLQTSSFWLTTEPRHRTLMTVLFFAISFSSSKMPLNFYKFQFTRFLFANPLILANNRTKTSNTNDRPFFGAFLHHFFFQNTCKKYSIYPIPPAANLLWKLIFGPFLRPIFLWFLSREVSVVWPFVLGADNGDMCTSSDMDDKSVSPVITVHALLPPWHGKWLYL